MLTWVLICCCWKTQCLVLILLISASISYILQWKQFNNHCIGSSGGLVSSPLASKTLQKVTPLHQALSAMFALAGCLSTGPSCLPMLTYVGCPPPSTQLRWALSQPLLLPVCSASVTFLAQASPEQLSEVYMQSLSSPKHCITCVREFCWCELFV